MKTAASLVLLSAIALSTTTQASRVWQNENTETVDEYLQGARGFYYGFQQGLYKLDKVDETCLSKQAEEKIVELFDLVVSMKLDVSKMMSLVGDVMTITSSLSTCNINSVSDLSTFCFGTGKNICTPDKIAENVQKNLFLLMAKFTDISNLMMGGIPKDAEAAYAFGRQAGLDVGSLIRVVIGFHN